MTFDDIEKWMNEKNRTYYMDRNGGPFLRFEEQGAPPRNGEKNPFTRDGFFLFIPQTDVLKDCMSENNRKGFAERLMTAFNAYTEPNESVVPYVRLKISGAFKKQATFTRVEDYTKPIDIRREYELLIVPADTTKRPRGIVPGWI
jgi:hypothetical protein